jgi:PAS domain-containing protein
MAQTKKQVLNLTDEGVVRKILVLFVSITLILLVQGVYNIISIKAVDGSIETLYTAMERINGIEIEINVPINELRRKSMTQVMAPNRQLAGAARKDIAELEATLDRTLEKWRATSESLGLSVEMGVVLARWNDYKKAVAVTSDFVDQQIREASFLNNTSAEQEAFEALVASVRRLVDVQYTTRDRVHREAIESAAFSFWLSLVTTVIEILLLKVITLIIVRMVKNYIQSMRANAEDLRVRREFFRQLIKSIPGIFYRLECKDPANPSLTFISDGVEEIGVSAEACMSRGMGEYDKFIDAGDVDDVLARRLAAAEKRTDFSVDYELTDASGKRRTFSEVGTFVAGTSGIMGGEGGSAALIGFIFDISQRKELERQNELQRRKIGNLLSKTPIGILTIGHGDRIGQYSPEVAAILGTTENLAGKSVVTEIFRRSRLSKERADMQIAAIAASVGEHTLNFELNRSCFVDEIVIELSSGTSKHLELSWSFIEGEDDSIDELILCMKDVTEFRAIKQADESRTRELRRLDAVANLDPTLAQELFKNLRELLEAAERTALGHIGAGEGQEEYHAVLRYLHTAKGNARSLAFDDLSEATHVAEELVSAARTISRESYEQIRRCLACYVEYFEIGLKINKVSSDQDAIVQVSESDILGLLDVAKKIEPVDLRQTMCDRVNALRSTSLQNMLAPVKSGLPRIARGLNRKVPSIAINSSVPLRRESTSFFAGVFNHLIRNSIAHGFDSADGPGEARIDIDVKLDPSGSKLLIDYRDDGRGLDLRRIAEKAAEMKIAVNGDVMNLANCIFSPGFSTSDIVTDVAGRGVGMEAIRNSVNERGGNVQLLLQHERCSNEFAPFTFRMVVPREAVCHVATSSRAS